MRRTNKNLNVINLLKSDGTITELATYDGKYSAEFALALYYCKLFGLDCTDSKDWNLAKSKIVAGYSLKTCSFKIGEDIYSCCAPEFKLYNEGISSMELNFAPAI